jgi:hypothetical protein
VHFYRDKSGLEVDLIREFQRRPFAIEIKAAATFSPEMLSQLERFLRLHGNPAGAAVVHSGPRQPSVRGVSVCNHADVAELLFASERATR